MGLVDIVKKALKAVERDIMDTPFVGTIYKDLKTAIYDYVVPGTQKYIVEPIKRYVYEPIIKPIYEHEKPYWDAYAIPFLWPPIHFAALLL